MVRRRSDESLFHIEHSRLNERIDLALIYKDAVVSEESKHMRFLLFAPALSLVNLLCGKDSDFDPRIDFFLLLLVGLALDVRNKESGDDPSSLRRKGDRVLPERV